jgi:hypothetical protein
MGNTDSSTKIIEHLSMMYELVEGCRGEDHFCVTSGERVLASFAAHLGRC